MYPAELSQSQLAVELRRINVTAIIAKIRNCWWSIVLLGYGSPAKMMPRYGGSDSMASERRRDAVDEAL